MVCGLTHEFASVLSLPSRNSLPRQTVLDGQASLSLPRAGLCFCDEFPETCSNIQP